MTWSLDAERITCPFGAALGDNIFFSRFTLGYYILTTAIRYSNRAVPRSFCFDTG